MKLTAILISYFLCTTLGFSQNEPDKVPFKERLIIDGNLTLQFGNPTLIGGNPQLGVSVTKKILLGVGYSYHVFSFRDFGGTVIRDRFHGPTGFARVLVTNEIFLRSDYQNLIFILNNASDAPPETFNRNRWFIGGGYRTQISGKLYATVGAYLDLLDPIARPFLRAGIEIGL